MSLNESILERILSQFESRIQTLESKVAELEKRAVKSRPSLKKRIQNALADAKNDLALARDRAKDNNDVELMEALEDLMLRVT